MFAFTSRQISLLLFNPSLMDSVTFDTYLVKGDWLQFFFSVCVLLFFCFSIWWSFVSFSSSLYRARIFNLRENLSTSRSRVVESAFFLKFSDFPRNVHQKRRTSLNVKLNLYGVYQIEANVESESFKKCFCSFICHSFTFDIISRTFIFLRLKLI